MELKAAVETSAYAGEAAAYYHGTLDVYVVVDGPLFGCEVVDSGTGERTCVCGGMTLDEIEHQFPGRNWYPIRENGEWGDEAEAQA